MKIALVYSIKCSANLLPNGFDIEGLYETQGLTGSESGFFNIAWGLAERGHEVDAYCFTKDEVPKCEKLAGVNVKKIAANKDMPQDYDAIIAWNDPSHLPLVKGKALRLCSQQLNDFSISTPDYDRRTDVYAFPSEAHRLYVAEHSRLKTEKTCVVPNSTNVEFFWPNTERVPGSMLYCSSPDRGLHRLLDIFPLVRQVVPHATLKIFYRFWPWHEQTARSGSLVGARARYIGKKLKELGFEGENGVTLVGPVPNKTLAHELSTTALLAYPCATVRFTEGFSISTLDGCAAGCLPVISDVDALGSIYEGVCEVIKGPVHKQILRWAGTISHLLIDEEARKQKAERARMWAQQFSRQAVSQRWEKLIEEKMRPPAIEVVSEKPAEKKRPKVTVTLGSNRPGGIDVALAGLAGQSYQDFEVVFVDGRYHERHGRVLEAVKKSGLKQPFIHVPNYRYSDGIWGTPCAGYNTGFALADGEIVVMLLDYGYAPPAWLDHHVAHQAEPKVIMAPHEYRTLIGAIMKDGTPAPFDFHARALVDGRPPEAAIHDIMLQKELFDEISVLPEWFEAAHLSRFPREESDAKCTMATGVSTWSYFNTKNESFPLEKVLECNGMDENYDRGRGPGDPDLGMRLCRLGLAPWVVNEAIVHCLNPRRILPNINIVIPEGSRLPPPYEDRWYIQDGYKYFDMMKAQPGHRAPNRKDIRDLRREIWGWREMSQDPRPLIPKNVVSDKDYY